MSIKKVIVLLAGLLFSLPSAHADTAVAGEALAAALNQRQSEAMMRMLDVDAIVRLVVKDLGLSAADRDSVRRGLPRALRSTLDMSVNALETNKGSARYL